jgi:hypothetical protein
VCTVSFYKDNEKVIITSNRDENINRPDALPPTKIKLENTTVFCPIDPQHQGTWFAVNQKGNVFVLLNGAEEKHIPNPPYRKSRGLILLDIADSTNYFDKWNLINLENIEPFTIVAFFNKNLIQYTWNGVAKKNAVLDTNIPHIWSSATLYHTETIALRKEWFVQFINQNKEKLEANDFLKFHSKTNNEDKHNGLIINRNNMMLTKNITQCVLEKSSFTLLHQDLIMKKQTIISEKIYEAYLA